jgi:hypothetical protein
LDSGRHRGEPGLDRGEYSPHGRGDRCRSDGEPAGPGATGSSPPGPAAGIGSRPDQLRRAGCPAWGRRHTDGHRPAGYRTDGYRTDGYRTDGFGIACRDTDRVDTDRVDTEGCRTAGLGGASCATIDCCRLAGGGLGSVGFASSGRDLAGCDTVRFDTVRFDTVRFDTVRLGIVGCDPVGYGTGTGAYVRDPRIRAFDLGASCGQCRPGGLRILGGLFTFAGAVASAKPAEFGTWGVPVPASGRDDDEGHDRPTYRHGGRFGTRRLSSRAARWPWGSRHSRRADVGSLDRHRRRWPPTDRCP